MDIMIKAVDESPDYLHNIWDDWIRTRNKLIIKMLFEHALRPKELLCMKFDDMDLQKRTLKIRRKNNKIRKDRLVPMNKKIAPLLLICFNFPRWLWKNSHYIFQSFTNQYLSSQRWKHIFRKKCLNLLVYGYGQKNYRYAKLEVILEDIQEQLN